MDVGNWINLGLLLLTAVGVIVASRQALVAKRAADSAQRHEAEALRAAQQSASANERAAHALEEANALVRQASEKPRWRVVPLGRSRYRLENQGPGSAFDVRLDLPESPRSLTRLAGEPIPELEEGLALSFLVSRTFGTPADPTLVVTWTGVRGGDDQSSKCTLST